MSDNDPQLILVECQKIKEYIWANQDYIFWRGFMAGTAYTLGTAVAFGLVYKCTVRDASGSNGKLADLGAVLRGVYKALLK
jgi:hypothetical protein